jgi:hypothetical protein
MTTGASDAYWHKKLTTIDGDSAGAWDQITVKAADVTGDGQKELIVGIRFMGTGHILDYDVAQYLSGHPLTVIAHRGDFESGQAKIEGGGITDYAGHRPSGGGPCCDYWTRSVLHFAAGAFHITGSSTQATPPGTLDFP